MRLIVVLLVLAAASVLAVGAYWAASPGARSVAVTDGQAPPTSIPAPDIAPKVEARKGEVALEITEAQLNESLAQQLSGRDLGRTPLGRATLERIETTLRRGRVELSGSAQLGGASVPYSAVLTPAADTDGHARVRVTEAKVASLPMPEAARAEVESSVQAQLDRLLATRPMRVRSIEIGDGRMRVIGTPTG